MIQKDNEETRGEAARIIANGGVIAFRTDTFYGLGVDPLNREAIRKVKQLKGREDHKPILLLISDLNQVDKFVAQSDFFKFVAARHWPAPLTLIAVSLHHVPIELTAGTNSLGIRLPDDENVRDFVRACGGALTATSANISGQPPARTAQEVESYFPDGLEMIIDAGQVSVSEPSTVVDLSGREPRVIREGAIPLEELAPILTGRP
jgi:L-threonylcarbamoyladenylate synthase